MKTNLPDTGRPATVLVCSSDAVFRGRLTGLLGEICPCRVTVTQCPAEAITSAMAQPPDLFVCFHEPPVVDGILLVTELRKKVWVPVLLAARDWSVELVKAAVVAGTAAFLNSFPGQAELALALYEARVRLEHDDELRNKLHDVEQRLADRKLIEKAKGLLMEQQQISEDAAFRMMRNRAMTRRITMAKVAEGVITGNGQPD